MADAIEVTRGLLRGGLSKAVSINQAPVDLWIRAARRTSPDASPAEVIASLERQFQATVMSLGAASGAAAAVPGLSTGAGVATAFVEIPAFLEASAIFAQAVAEVHGVRVIDPERREALILAITLGGSGSAVMEKAAGRTGAHWGRLLVQKIPMSSIHKVNNVLGRNFVTKYGTKQGILVLGRAAPFGIGAGLGAAGNLLLARASITASRRAFGPPPETFPTDGSFADPAPEPHDILDAEIVAEEPEARP